MERTMTVKGIGRAAAKPDCILIPLTLSAKDIDYEKAMETAAAQHAVLGAALAGCGIEDVKTADFTIDTSYVGEHDERGNYRERFDGYVCTHRLNVEFDLSMEKLARVMGAIGKSAAEPAYSIRFTVKDARAVAQAALESAARDARAKAQFLAAASGVALGELVRVDYRGAEAALFSPTQVNRAMKAAADVESMDIAPEDVRVVEEVSFVWEIE